MARKFSIKEALKFGWSTVKKNGGFFVTVTFIVGIVKVIPGLVAKALEKDYVFLPIAINLLGSIVSLIVSIGLIKIVLKCYDDEQPKFSDLFSCAPLFFRYLAASTLYGLICFAGTLLLIVPGIIWSIQFAFYGYLIIDKDLGPVAALKRSSLLTKGVKWNLIIFGIVFVAINILGALVLLVGLFISIPVTMLAAGYVYRKLLEDQQAAEAEPVKDEKTQTNTQDRGQANVPR